MDSETTGRSSRQFASPSLLFKRRRLFCRVIHGIRISGIELELVCTGGLSRRIFSHANIFFICSYARGCYPTVYSLVYLFVPGASNFCVACGHGGHTYHLMTWFESMDMCPSGCGCRCLEVGTFIVDWPHPPPWLMLSRNICGVRVESCWKDACEAWFVVSCRLVQRVVTCY